MRTLPPHSKRSVLPLVCLVISSLGCDSTPESVPLSKAAEQHFLRGDEIKAITHRTAASAEQEVEINALIEQLVFTSGRATDQPVLSPGVEDNTKEYRNRFETCQKAFQELTRFKDLAFPILVEHLHDKRQSINFRNHYQGNSVGDACYWCVYLQLLDHPADYSRYGYTRRGRDGKPYPKPYWKGTPFDGAGGLSAWLVENEKLNYIEMQMKCIEWLLNKEKQIGAPDPESYHVNILPLEIRLLELRLKNGENVQAELSLLQKVRDERQGSSSKDELPEILEHFE